MEPKTELQRNAIVEARRQELQTYQRAVDIQWLNSRMEDGRMGRCLALIQKEAEMEKDFQERTDHAAIVNARAEKETALGIEIANLRREEASKLLRRHQLRERDPELRQLMTKLQAGYVCRDLKLQIQNNEYKRLQEKAEDKKANAILLNSLGNDLEAKESEERDKIERTTAYKRDLQQQLVNREREKQCQYEDTLIERKMLEEVMRTIADEDHREIELKRTNTSRMRQEVVTFKQARDAWREKQKEIVVREEREIEKQRAAAADRSSAIVAERERKMIEKEKLNERIANKIMADEAERQERENIIKQLQEQEYLEKNSQDDIAERDKALRLRRDTMKALTTQMDDKKRIIKEQREMDAQLRKISEAEVAVSNQKEADKESQKREKQRKYAEELKLQIQANSVKRQKERVMEDDRARYVRDCDKAWREEVSRERQEIVKEHAPPVLGYLQAAVIKKEDLPAIRRGADGRGEAFQRMDVEGMATSTRPQRHSKCNEQCRVIREY